MYLFIKKNFLLRIQFLVFKNEVVTKLVKHLTFDAGILQNLKF